MKKYDLIIIGAGIAGLSLARELKNSGLKILILDKKKNVSDVTYFSSGSFIYPDEFNLPQKILHPLKRISFHSKNRTATKSIKCCVIDRIGLLRFLEKESKRNKNLTIQYRTRVIKAVYSGNNIQHIVFSRGKKAKAEIYIDCSGISGLLARKSGLITKRTVSALGVEYLFPLKADSHTAHFFVGKDIKKGYGWIFPKDKKTAIAGFGTIEMKDYRRVDELFFKMWKKWKFTKICKSKPVRRIFATLRTGRPLQKFVKNNLLILGDSALQANPLIGEGIRFVMDASRMAAPAAKMAAKSGKVSCLKSYEKRWLRKYYKNFKRCFFMQRVLKVVTGNDRILDLGTGVLDYSADNNFKRVISADISIPFFIRVVFSALVEKYLKKP